MHMIRYQRARLTHLVVPLLSIGCLLLVALLAGCGQRTTVQKHPLAGKLNLLSVPAPYDLPGKIVRGPDGNLWFPAVAYAHFATDKPSGAIGQLTPDGTFHFFPMTTPNTYPLDIAFGRDGTLWFSAFRGNGKLAPMGDVAPHFTGGNSELGRMSLDGHFHLFTLPRATISLSSIAVGADGDLWFTDVSNAGAPAYAYVNKIGRVTPSGVFTEFPLTLHQSGDFVKLLIAGPDGNLCFSIESTLSDYSVFGEMGRMTPQGTVKIFSLGKFVEPRDLTIGPDGNIWFSTSFDNGGSSLDMGNLRGIAAGKDGSLWLTNDGQIGHFV